MDAKEAAEQLRLVLENDQGICRIIIAGVDPDAIGAAIAFKSLLKNFFNRESVILFCGAIAHPQNRYIVMRYNLKHFLKPISSDPEANKGLTVLIDSCSHCDPRLPKGMVFKPRIVIDHHREPGDDAENDGLVWIEDLGAAATLVVELCQELDPDVLKDPLVALLLALAIHTDTDGMKDPRTCDRVAMNLVCQYVDHAEFKQAIDYTIPLVDFQRFARAVNGLRFENGTVVTGVGAVEPDAADIVSTVSERLKSLEGATKVFVWVLTNGVIRISARTRGTTVDLGEFLRSRFRNGGAKFDSQGNGSGGAVLDLQIPTQLMEPDSLPALEKWIDETIKRCIFES